VACAWFNAWNYSDVPNARHAVLDLTPLIPFHDFIVVAPLKETSQARRTSWNGSHPHEV